MKEDKKLWRGGEKRRAPRIETANVVEYTIFDDERKTLDKGLGSTINLSQSGLLLRTPKPLKGVFVVVMTIDLDGKRIQVDGKLVYSVKDEDSLDFLSGIEFTGPKDQQVQAIIAFVKAYQRKKHVKDNPI